MPSVWRLVAPAGIPFLIGIGVQLAGFESDRLGYAFMAIGLLWGIAYAVYYFFFRGEQAMAESGKGDHIEFNIEKQYGGTNIGKIVLPQPGIKKETVFENQDMGDGTYGTRAIVSIDDGYAAKGLKLEAHGTSITSGDFQPLPNPSAAETGVDVHVIGPTVPVMQPPKYWAFHINPRLAPGYLFEVRTRPAEKVRVDAAFL